MQQLSDLTSLALHQVVAERLLADERVIALALENLAAWSRRNSDSPRLLAGYNEWRELLKLPREEIAALLVETSDRAQRLRSNSPFPGVLTPAEVWEIKRRCWDEAKRARTAN